MLILFCLATLKTLAVLVFESKQATSLEKRIAKRRRLAYADSALKIVATGLEESSIMDVLDTAKAVEEDLDVFFEEGDQNWFIVFFYFFIFLYFAYIYIFFLLKLS